MIRKLTPLKELIEEISMGPFGSDITVDNYKKSGVPVLNGSNVSGVKLIETFQNYVTPEKADSLKKANAKKGDIIITHRGTLGQVAYIPNDCKLSRYIISQSQFRVKLNTSVVDPIFFTYYFHSSEGQKRLLSFKNHVGVPALAQATTNFRLLDFPLIPVFDQKKIAKVLSDLDAKIELNNKINAELEAMTKLLYDYWFVQFDFPDENGKPYKSSGGKMVYNEELKREIPLGWEVGGFADLGQIVGGTTPSRSKSENFIDDGSGIPWITPKDLSINSNKKFIARGERDVTQLGIKDGSLKIMPPGTILLTSRAPIGYIAITREPSTTNQGFKNIVPNSDYSMEFVFFTTQLYIPAMKQYASGSTFQEISGTVLKTIKIPLPPKKIVISFTERIKSVFGEQNNLESQNQQLAELRDWLLPMLMNGQVRVGEAEEETKVVQHPKTKEFSTKDAKVRRKMLATYIINQSLEDKSFGKTKFEKLLHLIEYHVLQQDYKQTYSVQAAGPYDGRFTKVFWNEVLKSQWFDFKEQGKLQRIVAGTNHTKSLKDYGYLSDNEKEAIQSFIQIFSNNNYERPEIISTLYAVWNNRIIRNEMITDELLKKDFLEWDTQKARYKNRLDKALQWMRENDLVPTGWGKVIEKAKKR